MKEKLIGGMALPRGVMFMTKEHLAAGYYDDEGQLQIYTHPISTERFRLAGSLGEVILEVFEGWRAIWQMEPDKKTRNAVLAVFLAGIITGILIRYWGIIPPPIAAIILLGLLIWYRPFHQFIGQIRRYHAAEHMVFHALEETGRLPTLEEVRRQPMLNPNCGSNIVMLLLPTFFLPYWLILLFLPVALKLFDWMNNHVEHPVARALLSFTYLGQRLTLAPPEDRELQAALKALEELEKQK